MSLYLNGRLSLPGETEWREWGLIVEGFCPNCTDDEPLRLEIIELEYWSGPKRWGYCARCLVAWRAFTGGYIDKDGQPYGHTIESCMLNFPGAMSGMVVG